MIESIKLNSCTPYVQTEISGCKKINFIFGANGSGKSTISTLLSGTDDPRFALSSIVWTGETHERIEVYNREFRRSNLQQEMEGIFTLGSATIDDIRELDRLKSELDTKRNGWEEYCKSYNTKNDEEKPAREAKFKEDAWTQILKQNEGDYQKAFEGFRNSKERFLTELKRRIAGIDGHNGTVCDRKVLKERAQTLFVTKPEQCSEFLLDIDMLFRQLEGIRVDTIWDTVIVGSSDVDIAALIEELGNSSWVSQGRQYIKTGSNRCPFCQQETISDTFRLKLERFFDADFKQKVERMSALLTEYRGVAQQIIDSIETAVIGMDVSIRIGRLELSIYTAKKELLKTQFEANARKIEDKIMEPGIRISLTDISDSIKELKESLAAANALIVTHNKLVSEQNTEEIRLRDDVWATCIHDASALIKTYQKDISDIENAIKGIGRARERQKAEVDKLSALVEEKGKNITSVQPTIDEINRSLKAYGFTSFSIQPADGHENSYCIKRDDGTYATNTLSEGEETFLTFLYFMQRAKGSTDKTHVSDKKIIVLDDPISSLDSRILYIVGAIVKDLSEKIRKGQGDVTQLFVLTHNVFFHKEASFIDGRTFERSDTNYWIVQKNNGVSTIKPYGMKNPISTSYEILWKELKENNNSSLISIQNTMRRIIENYFGMLGGRRDDYLISQFESLEEKMIAKSLLYWINDGSHSIPDDLFIDSYTDAVPRYKEVFRAIFEKSNHIAHYNMMMGIKAESGENGIS